MLILSLSLFLNARAFGAIAGYHGDARRSGDYIAPGLSWAAARHLRRDAGFDGRVSGNVYAQPLYWHGMIIVATESDEVDALDAGTGRAIWRVRLGAPTRGSALPCGDIDPVGVTGTPVIDPARGALYLAAMVKRGGQPRYLVFGLRLSDGKVLPGWPIDARQALRREGIAFNPLIQGQRSALALLDNRVFIAFGGRDGDCGPYHGIVLGIGTDPPAPAAAWKTRGVKGGIWAPGGISAANGALFFTTGNTSGARRWADGEGVFRLGPNLTRASNPRDFFAPANWRTLDDDDLDMSGVDPLPIDLPGAHRLLALGKDGDAYLLNRDDLGGIGGQIAIRHVADSEIITAPAFFPEGNRVLVAYQAGGALCPNGGSGGIAALAVTATSLAPAWCAPFDGRGSPIVTTTDGHSDPIVWAVGTRGDGRLHAYRGDTGAPLYASRSPIPGMAPFITILPADGRLYVAASGRITAFTWSGR
ncbi:MAG TPA: hypothetical protein VFN77_05230 [Acetobacteraceae bacterium]|nr:hypothetical protein [Acetobacteraceae bacterium]